MNMNRSIRYWVMGVCLLLSPMVYAQTATEFLRDVSNRLIAKLDSEHDAINKDLNNAVKIVDSIIMPVTDFELIGKRVLGAHWRQASEQQRQAFMKEFKLLLIVTYAAAFRSYKDQTVEFTGEIADPNNPDRVEVRTAIRQPGAAPIPVNYRVQRENGQWKVYDFNVEGVGLTSSFRSQFNNAISQKGMNAVIAEMKQKNIEVFK